MFVEIILTEDFEFIIRISSDPDEISKVGENLLDEATSILKEILQANTLPAPTQVSSGEFEYHVSREVIKDLQLRYRTQLSSQSRLHMGRGFPPRR